MGIEFDSRFAAVTTLAVVAIFVVSSIPDLTQLDGPVFNLFCNVLHAPVYGVVALLWLRTFKARAPIPGRVLAWALMASAACGVVDEVHQSFVPGRFASAGDLLTDLVGIGVVLLFKRLPAATAVR